MPSLEISVVTRKPEEPMWRPYDHPVAKSVTDKPMYADTFKRVLSTNGSSISKTESQKQTGKDINSSSTLKK